MAINTFTGATNNDFGTSTNWSQGTVPTASDGHITTFDATSPACSLGASNRVCQSFDASAYLNTLSFGTRSLTVSGNIVLGASMTITGTGTLIINDTGSITSNGYIVPLSFQFAGTSKTYTLQDDLNLGPAAALSLNGTTALTINNNGSAKVIYAGENISSSAAGSQGTAKFVMNGTGNLSNTAAIRNDLEINTTLIIQP
jgi:hypothetical protein